MATEKSLLSLLSQPATSPPSSQPGPSSSSPATTTTPTVPSLPDSPTISPLASPSSKRRRSSDVGPPTETHCSVCHVKYYSAEDRKLNSPSVKCSKSGCEWRLHLSCIHIFLKPGVKFERFGKLLNHFCKNHAPK